MEQKKITLEDLPKMPTSELKAMVYDIAAEIQTLQRSVNIVNQEISKRAEESASKLTIPPAETDSSPSKVA